MGELARRGRNRTVPKHDTGTGLLVLPPPSLDDDLLGSVAIEQAPSPCESVVGVTGTDPLGAGGLGEPLGGPDRGDPVRQPPERAAAWRSDSLLDRYWGKAHSRKALVARARTCS